LAAVKLALVVMVWGKVVTAALQRGDFVTLAALASAPSPQAGYLQMSPSQPVPV
jgi:hypothetical protein